MDKYFFLENKVKKGTAFAYTKGEVPLAHHLLNSVKELDCLPFDLYLKSVESTKNGYQVSEDLSLAKCLWVDYQPNCLAWPLMSGSMKAVVEEHLNGSEHINWIQANVCGLNNEIRPYYIPCFHKRLDILNKERTLYVKGTNHVIKPVFSISKLLGLHFFHQGQEIAWEITSALYVSQKLMSAMKKSGISGVGFDEVQVG